MAKRFGLPKTARLKSRRQIDDLFAGGKSFSVFPIRVTYRFTGSAEGSLQIGVTASKRYFKKAVDRNRIKRLLREAYRLQKEELQMQLRAAGKNVAVFFLFTDKSLPTFDVLKSAMAKCLKKLGTIADSENPS
jgi:ribonuclease P protein component